MRTPDPASFGEHALADPAIRSLCRRVTVLPEPGNWGHGDVPSTVTITTNDGRELTRRVEAFQFLETGLRRDTLTAAVPGGLRVSGTGTITGITASL